MSADDIHTHDLEEALRWEQECLWDDLMKELDRAANGYWSTGSENKARRIVAIAKLVGPIHWSKVPTNLVLGEVYAAIIRKADFNADTTLTLEDYSAMVARHPNAWARWNDTAKHILSDKVTLDDA